MFNDLEIEQDCKSANKINLENLQKILGDNQHTKFGQLHGFSTIKNPEEYKRKVPLSYYEDFHPYVEQMMSGEENILTAYPIEAFVKTSGSVGKQKFIPITREALEHYSDYIERYKNTVFSEQKGKRFFLNVFRTDLHKAASRIQILSETYYRFLAEKQKLKEKDYLGGFDLMFRESSRGDNYAKVWMAFAEEHIVLFESIFLYDQLIFFQYMERHWKEVLQDMQNGCIPQTRGVPRNLQKLLLKIPVDKARIKYVEEQCSRGFDQIAKRLWPNLCLASGIGNKSFYTEDFELRKYLRGVELSYFSYVASECHLGAALECEKDIFVMLPRSAFYEYIPYDEASDDRGTETLLPEELEIGKMYEVVLTTFSGLYRYRLGDVVRITDFYHESPCIAFEFRRNQVLNLAGEKMDIYQLEQSVCALNRKLSGRISQYSAAVKDCEIPGRYVFAFAGEARQEGEKTDYAGLIDEELKKSNVDYEDLRNLSYIEKPEVFFLDSEAYIRFMKENDYGNGHGKSYPIASKGFSEKILHTWRERDEKRAETF